MLDVWMIRFKVTKKFFGKFLGREISKDAMNFELCHKIDSVTIFSSNSCHSFVTNVKLPVQDHIFIFNTFLFICRMLCSSWLLFCVSISSIRHHLRITHKSFHHNPSPLTLPIHHYPPSSCRRFTVMILITKNTNDRDRKMKTIQIVITPKPTLTN